MAPLPIVVASVPPEEREPDIVELKARMVAIAHAEYARWHPTKGKPRQELDSRMTATLLDYWKNGAGVTYKPKQMIDATFQDDHPWSATFISWVLRKAGAGKRFKYASAHATYVVWAKKNRSGGALNTFYAYRTNEITPQVGDLVCKQRVGKVTYDTVAEGMKTHSDIVVEVLPDKLVSIGGNVKQSVSKTEVKLDKNGFIKDPSYFAILRISYTLGDFPQVGTDNIA